MRSPFNYRFGLPSPFYDNETGSFSPASLFALSEPGVWFDPSDVANLDWRRNLLQWTEQFDNAYWVKAQTTVPTTNDVLAPNGTMTAEKIVESLSASLDHTVRPPNASISYVAGTEYTISAYFKAAERTWVNLQLPSVPFTTAKRAWFDLANGVPGSVSTGATSDITPVGGGWYRCSLTTTATATNIPATSAVLGLATGDTGQAYEGDGTSGAYFWGAQLEAGTLTDYQPITDLNTAVISRFPKATLYQDVAATIPVYSTGQTVALMLDKSKGLVLGSELVAIPSIEADDWTSSDASIVVVDGSITFTGSIGSMTASLTSGFGTAVPDALYEVSISVSSYTTGNVRFRLRTGVTATVPITGVGVYKVLVQSGSGTLNAIYSGTVTTTLTIDNVSVKELAGNHAQQATTTARPTYGIEPAGGRRNLLTYSEDLTNAIWGKAAVTSVTPTPGAALDGTSSADLVLFAAAGRLGQALTVTAGTTVTATIRVKRINRNYHVLAVAAANTSVTNASIARFNLQTLVLETSENLGTGFTLVGTPTITALTNGYVQLAVQVTVAGTTAALYTSSTESTVTNTASAGAQCYFSGAQLELGSTATDYQRVTTQFDVTEAGKAAISYLWFDGLTDAMGTSTITPGIDKAQVFTGVRTLRTADECVVEFSPDFSSNAGSFTLFATVLSTGYAAASRGSAALSPSQTVTVSAPAPATSVISTTHDIPGDLTAFRLNGGAATNATGDQGAGNFLAYPLYLGSRGGVSDPFQGHIYSQITRFGTTLTAATITSTDAWVAGKTGFYTPIIEGVPTIGVS